MRHLPSYISNLDLLNRSSLLKSVICSIEFEYCSVKANKGPIYESMKFKLYKSRISLMTNIEEKKYCKLNLILIILQHSVYVLH